jgi:hypothetical protein
VGVGKNNVGTGVKVGSGVNVLRGVAVNGTVAVAVGRAAIVWTAAASAVCAMNWLMAFESSGGIGVGVAKEGVQETIITKARSHIILLLRRVAVGISGIQYIIFFNDLLHAPDRSTLQADLDPMRMGRRFGEYILDDAPGQFACGLILL